MARLTLLLACLALAPGASEACSCSPLGTPEEALAASDRVFLGAATTVELRCDHPNTKPFIRKPGQGVEIVCTSPSGEEHSFPIKLATFMVSENFKGTGSVETLQTELYGAMCGVEFVAGEEYVVYAKRQDGVLTASLCSRTGVATDKESGLSVLRDGG
ncbi:hypothetical protein H0E84_08170 [Luteimonas sp. SJ-92]|uniref:Uncharacterized protein n=1 Tax=Luteimonas salinisoli TaxID=2752307 RepID=A0A853JCK6_9GAMM|nr:hypothetical protein [Luteimonas salinisoli]